MGLLSSRPAAIWAHRHYQPTATWPWACYRLAPQSPGLAAIWAHYPGLPTGFYSCHLGRLALCCLRRCGRVVASSRRRVVASSHRHVVTSSSRRRVVASSRRRVVASSRRRVVASSRRRIVASSQSHGHAMAKSLSGSSSAAAVIDGATVAKV